MKAALPTSCASLVTKVYSPCLSRKSWIWAVRFSIEKKRVATWVLFLFLLLFAACGFASEKKALICGVCKNVEHAAENTFHNIEELGSRFADYAVIIYENNSSDSTVARYRAWAESNTRICFLSENLPAEQLPASRTEKIARARNIVLSVARGQEYCDFDYLIMADLDFHTEWPYEEIVKTTQLSVEWDCISANGFHGNNYYDHYALRDRIFPLGPELLDSFWWRGEGWGEYRWDGEELVPVYSAFGGLAIYKMSSILPFSYSGLVTDDLTRYYREILSVMTIEHPYAKAYLSGIGKGFTRDLTQVPIIYRCNTLAESPRHYPYPTCCEHVSLHASMAMHGFGKHYINPKLILRY